MMTLSSSQLERNYTKYIFVASLAFIATAFYYYFLGKETPQWLSFHVLSLLCSLLFIQVGLRSKNIYIVIFLFQILLISIILSFQIVEMPNDYFTYTESVKRYLSEPSFFGPLNKIIDSDSEADNFNDLGYYIPIIILYRLFSPGTADIWMWALKLICHIVTCHILYSLVRELKIPGAKLIVLIWGCNIYNSYFIVGGLKEPLFVMFTIMASYSMYLFISKPSFLKFTIFVIAVIATFGFRATFPFYYIGGVFGYYLLRRLPSNYIFFILGVGILLATIGGAIIVKLFPVAALLFEDRNMVFDSQGGGFVILNSLNAFISPYPAFTIMNQNVNLVTTTYSILHTSLAFFSILGIIHAIRFRMTILYPLLFTAFLNSLMLIVAGFAMNARYSYPLVALYYLFIPLGIVSSNHKMKKVYGYLLIVLVISVLYNNR